MMSVQRHEIDQRVGALLGLKMGFEHRGLWTIAARDAGRLLRRDRPAAMLARAKERGETSLRVETRTAIPIDRAVAGNKGGGPAVTDQRIVFDERHGPQENSTMTLISSGCRCSDRVQCSAGSRRVIIMSSQRLSAFRKASPAIS